MDWSEKNSCIKCDNGGNLLVCSENGCPLAVHESCLGCPAKFDELGHFYCPYCLYKQAVAESRKAREYALARKKALLVFMDENVIRSENQDGENKTFDEIGGNHSKTSKENGNITSRGDDKSKSENSGNTNKPILLDGEEKISNAKEDFEDSAGSEGEDPSLEAEKQVQEDEHEGSSEEEHIQEEEHKTSAQKQIQEEKNGSSSEEQIQEKEHETSLVKEQIQVEEHETSVEQIQEEKPETSSSSTDQDPSLTGHVRTNKRDKKKQTSTTVTPTWRSPRKPVKQIQEEKHETSSSSADQDPSLTGHARTDKHDKKKQTSKTVTPTWRSPRKSSVVTRSGKVLNDEVGAPGRLRKPQEPSLRLASDAFGSAKRKRLMWTEEEEDALRAGVEKYLKKSSNLPWKKILDFGRSKFDATRTPGDLKDKWRNMSGR